MRRLVELVLAVLCAAMTLMAAEHRYVVHPNPSIAILSIAEGPDGVLWLGAQDGLFQFDGLHYQRVQDFPLASVRHVVLTKDGTLWAGGPQGVARRKGEKFEVLLTELVLSMGVVSDQLFIRTTNRYLVGDAGGPLRALPFERGTNMTMEAPNKLWLSSAREPRATLANSARPTVVIENIDLPAAFEQVMRDSQGRLWAADQDRAVLVENGKQVLEYNRHHSQKLPRPYPLFPGRDGQLWFLGEVVQGLVRPEEFRDRAINDQYLPTAGFEDSRGHVWVARYGQGLVEWIREPRWERWSSEEFGQLPVAHVARTPRNEIVAATHNNLYRLEGRHWVPISKQPREYSAILPLADGGFLASIRRVGLARLNHAGEIVERPREVLPTVDEYRRIFRDSSGRIWVGNKMALLEVTGSPGSLRLRKEALPDISEGENTQAIDLQSDADGRLWVGYARGLAWKDDAGKWHRLPVDLPGLGVRSFAPPSGGQPGWVGFRGAETFVRVQENNGSWSTTVFAPQDGFGPEDTHFLQRDSRGWIWRGTPDGVHVSDGVHVDRNDWLHLSSLNGLATGSTDQYGFFEDTDGTIWISGEDGVSHLTPGENWFAAPKLPLRVSRFEWTGDSLRVDAGNIGTSSFRPFALRYRLLPISQEWQLSQDGSLRFNNLSPDSYTLEVAPAGLGATEPLRYSFRYNPLLRWSAWWSMIPLAMTLIGLFAPGLPWSERNRYRLRKGLFLIRRRLQPGSQSSSGPGAIAGKDYSGEVLANRYRVTRVISKGGFAVVYEAIDMKADEARVAVKVLHQVSGRESWLRDRFAHELAALKSIEHPAVVRVLDSWINAEGEPCLVMPVLEGPTLRQALKQGNLQRNQQARIIRDLGGALAEVHSRGIVHRDLKPENVILCRHQPIVIDFGTASFHGGQEELATTTLLSGSFHYMAPERLSGQYSPASDVYSLGVMILEIISGHRISDLGLLFSDKLFRAELERVLQSSVEAHVLSPLAAELSKAYDPKPQARPSDPRIWSGAIADFLERD